MIVLMFGGRKYFDEYEITKAFYGLRQYGTIDMVVHGGADGADKTCGSIARKMGIHTAVVDALWNNCNANAGMQRNSVMLKLNIDRAVMFPGGRGTIDMFLKCQEAGIEVSDPCLFYKQIPFCDHCDKFAKIAYLVNGKNMCPTCYDKLVTK